MGTDKIKLTNQDKKMKCEKIESNGFCGDKVENEDDKTAADFCKSCGCGGDTVPPAPTPSPPDEDCKDDTDKIKLTNQDKKMKCEKIESSGFCEDEVENEVDKTAADFCTICGCGGDPVPAPTPSPPDEDCKGDTDKIKLTNQDKKMKCEKIESNGFCKDEVENEVDKTAADFCTICGCG